MKTLKLLLVACCIQFSFGAISQTNQVLYFVGANQEYYLTVQQFDSITIINDFQAGDYSYGFDGDTLLSHKPFVAMGDTICKVQVIYDNLGITSRELYAFRGSNPGIPFVVYITRGFAGVDDLSSDSNISIYPNPTSDYLNIDTESMEPVKIYNLTGQLVLSAESGNKKIDISALNAGTYLVQIGLHSKRLVIE